MQMPTMLRASWAVSTKAPAVAPLLRLTAPDLVEFGIADEVVGDSVEATVEAVHRALREAEAGQRAKRLDAATAAWLRGDEDPSR